MFSSHTFAPTAWREETWSLNAAKHFRRLKVESPWTASHLGLPGPQYRIEGSPPDLKVVKLLRKSWHLRGQTLLMGGMPLGRPMLCTHSIPWSTLGPASQFLTPLSLDKFSEKNSFVYRFSVFFV